MIKTCINICRQIKKESSFLKKLVASRGIRAIINPQSDDFVVQRFHRFEINLPEIYSVQEFREWCNQEKVAYNEGRFTFYFSPVVKNKLLGDALSRFYPEKIGLKILKDFNPVQNSHYVTAKLLHSASRIGMHNLPAPTEQVAVANTLWINNLGPRVYDLVELQTKGSTLSCFVVEHIDGTPPSYDECITFLNELDNFFSGGVLDLTLPNWKNHMDFKCPFCNRNLIKCSTTSRLRYVDFQNFIFVNRKDCIRTALKEAKNDVHFGDKHLIRGGSYIYQSVPGMKKIAKRDTSSRFRKIVQILHDNGIKLEKRIVLDIGCNIGMILASCLSSGAWWGFGWDRPEVINHARRLLALLGFSRTDLFPVEITDDTDFEEYFPNWCNRDKLNDSIIFFLAMREHLGFPKVLAKMKWKAFVYEGHGNESFEDSKKYLQEFSKQSKSTIAYIGMYQDSISPIPRPIALLIRK